MNYGTSEAENAMSVLATWMGKNSKVKVIYTNSKRIRASPELGVIEIPKLSCASGISQEALMTLRGSVYHESGHIAETNLPKNLYPKNKAKFDILNSLEDVRIESKLARDHIGAGPVFRWNNERLNKEISAVMDPAKCTPVWEAVTAMQMKAQGIIPAWTLSEKAQKYVDLTSEDYNKVLSANSVEDCLSIAEEVYKKLKEANKEEQRQQEQDGKSDKKDKSDKQDKDEEDDSDSGGSESEEEEDGEDSESGGSDDGDGEDEEDDSDSDPDSASDKKDDKKSGNKKSKSANKGGKDKGNVEDDGTKAEIVEPSDDDADDDSREIDADIEAKIAKAIEDLLDKESEGKTKADVQNDLLEKELNAIPPSLAEYLSDRQHDHHETISVVDETRREYSKERLRLAPEIASMVWALKQAIRSMAKVRRLPYQRSGKIDERRYVQISKGLSKEVFKRTQLGMDLSVAVEIVIDESASMGGSKVEGARNLAIVIGETLDQLGIPFEITGTTTLYSEADRNMPPLNGFSRTNPIRYKHYKTFESKWQVCKSGVMEIGSYYHNIDGEAVEYCAFRLGSRKENRKIIFSLSDGQPIGGQYNDGTLAENIVKVCDRVRGAGIEVYGFGVCVTSPEKYYGKKHFVYLPSADQMGQDFVRKFAETLTAGKVKV